MLISRRKLAAWLGLGGAAATVGTAGVAHAEAARTPLPMWVEQTGENEFALIIRCGDGKDRVAFGWNYPKDGSGYVPEIGKPIEYPLMISWEGGTFPGRST